MTKQSGTDQILEELRAIKKLLVLGFLREGVSSQSEIGAALGVTQSAISKMFPKSIDFRASGSRKRDEK